ncbi:MAG: glycoside hydrolase family 10 protein [Candidatus Gracilibacteria bacterium]
MKKLLSLSLAFIIALQAFTPLTSAAEAPKQYAEIAPAKGEVRAVWVSRFQFKTKADIVRIMADIKKNNFNTVFFQVRGEADAFYKSSYEPWSKMLTGTLGKDPGYDPLQTAIDEGHKNGLQVHAWVNVFTVWQGKTAPDKTAVPQHLYYAHPEWFQVNDKGQKMDLNDSYIFADPANLDLQQHLIKVFREIVTKYNVDGLHLDYVRYPSASYGYSEISQKRFKAQKKFKDFSNWRRDELTKFVTKIADIVHETSAHKKKLSAAVIGYHVDKWNWGLAKSGSYDKYLQDSKRWIKESRVDFITPMIYWTIGAKPDFTTLVKDFASVNPNKVVVGMSTTDFSAVETWNQIMVTRANKMKGFSLFSYGSNNKLWDTFRTQIAKW